MSPQLPAPRSAGAYRIAVVCLGNICRSPMAEVVLSARVADARLADDVTVVSAGTGDWHVGEEMDDRAARLLAREGYDPTRHRAQQVPAAWLEVQDLVLAMDRQNLLDLRSLGAAEPERVRLFRDFDPDGGGEVPDPWSGGEPGFLDVLAMVERTSAALVDGLESILRR